MRVLVLPQDSLALLSVCQRYPSFLQRPVADNLLRNLESTRPGTAIFFDNTIGYKPHRLDQDVRRLRLRFLPNHSFGKVAVFSRVHSDSTKPPRLYRKRIRLCDHAETYHNWYADLDT